MTSKKSSKSEHTNLFNSKQRFLIKCKNCEVILSIELEDSDIIKYYNDQVTLECSCGGTCDPLRN